MARVEWVQGITADGSARSIKVSRDELSREPFGEGERVIYRVDILDNRGCIDVAGSVGRHYFNADKIEQESETCFFVDIINAPNW